MLRHVADAAEVADDVGSVSASRCPAGACSLGVIVGGILVAMYLPVFDLVLPDSSGTGCAGSAAGGR